MKLFEYIDFMQQPYDIFYTDSTHSPLHWHYYSEILYIISGSIKIVCNNKEKNLKKGDVCYFYPLQLHEVRKNKNETDEIKYTVIKFNIHTIHIPKAYLQKMYDYFVRRTADNDFCLVINEDESHENIGNIISHIVAEYKKRMPCICLQCSQGYICC